MPRLARHRNAPKKQKNRQFIFLFFFPFSFFLKIVCFDLFEMKNKGRMQIFENEKVVFGPRDYQENVRRSRKCRVDKFPLKMDGI